VRSRTSAPFRLIYIAISQVPIQDSCKTLTRGSARPAALENQVTLEGSILRKHLRDDREPRPTILLRPINPARIAPGFGKMYVQEFNRRIFEKSGYRLLSAISFDYISANQHVFRIECSHR
jgi:hypothetical protein